MDPSPNKNNISSYTPIKIDTNNYKPKSAVLNEVTKSIVQLKQNEPEKKLKNRSRGRCLLVSSPKKECGICHMLIETHLLKIHFNSHPSLIFRWLYLGTFSNACDINELRRIGIRYILNCAAECQNCHLPGDIKELHLNIRDEKNFNLFSYFEQANIFLNKIRLQEEIVLVHCKFGISRSASFIIAYLIKYFGFNVESALRYLKSKRTQINPNEGFLKQLYNYEKLFKTKDKV